MNWLTNDSKSESLYIRANLKLDHEKRTKLDLKQSSSDLPSEEAKTTTLPKVHDCPSEEANNPASEKANDNTPDKNAVSLFGYDRG